MAYSWRDLCLSTDGICSVVGDQVTVVSVVADPVNGSTNPSPSVFDFPKDDSWVTVVSGSGVAAVVLAMALFFCSCVCMICLKRYRGKTTAETTRKPKTIRKD